MSHKHKQPSAAHTLDELETLGDRAARWIAENPMIVLGTMAAILVIAGAVGLFSSQQQTEREEASAALSKVLGEYREAMGGSAGQIEVPEPANPETTRSVREQYAERLSAVASEYAGTAAGAVAALEAGNLEVRLDRNEAALETWTRALEGSEAAVEALLYARIGAAHDQAERWSQAADAYQRAAAIDTYPLADEALASAARCRIAAGESEAALSLYAELESRGAANAIPTHVELALRELRAAQ